MKVLITGVNGQVGFELLRLAPANIEVFGLDSRALDITDEGALNRVFAQIHPDLVINAAAYTSVDKAEAEPYRANEVNHLGVSYLGRAAERLSIPVFHLSTDYVFAGDANLPYDTDSQCIPASVYGASKLAGEEALAQLCMRHVIVRTSWVFGAHGSNFVKTMLRLAKTHEVLNVVADQRGAPTSAMGIANMLWLLTQRYFEQGVLPWGTYHYSGAPESTWHSFATEIFQEAVLFGLLERSPQVNSISTAQYPTPARRPKCSLLDCSKLQQTFGVTQDDWRLALKGVLQDLKK